MARTKTVTKSPRRKKRRHFGDVEELDSWDDFPRKRRGGQPQIELLLKTAPYYERNLPLPYEMLMKIFHHVVETSDHPLRDLCNIAQVCETWRQIIVQSPTLWYRIDMNKLPITDGNVRTLTKILTQNPRIIENLRDIVLGGCLECKDNNKLLAFMETLITAPKLTSLTIRKLTSGNRATAPGLITRSIQSCKNLKSLSITQSRILFNSQKWISDFLVQNGQSIEVLNLALSLTSVSSNLFRAVASDYCPKLRVLDISTCDSLNTRSFDAIQLAQNMPNLEILRLGNVSFKRVSTAPEEFRLKVLEELSMPIAMRDADRDDPLFSTLTYGSQRIKTLDLRGSCISPNALLDMPSCDLRELHIDDISPNFRDFYHKVIENWRHSLEILTLFKINDPKTVKRCLQALIDDKADQKSKIRDLDLNSTEVALEDLNQFLKSATSLSSINLSSCRSLPRGCKGLYMKDPPAESGAQPLELLFEKLGSDSDTSIDQKKTSVSRRTRSRR